eukprot:CAMPEP_0174386494 /NCGR_PEP_ID=MMETSP0811_2-20130205/127318_1 /TAXON_ID=73025 ORGANISM="Eutreptiella gymnastica-like, Strain CCMP1594" /NCGR_SAMPLE_ID=MMETSP0811_2 /ASSEMBLY_ACC=CAM_ASM_000667 /LENGTH=87 /DNA_ID=CAMNT_0015541191 /DNA_START=105 /DNA_END=368 /DNA_ORIENTATION=-
MVTNALVQGHMVHADAPEALGTTWKHSSPVTHQGHAQGCTQSQSQIKGPFFTLWEVSGSLNSPFAPLADGSRGFCILFLTFYACFDY